MSILKVIYKIQTTLKGKVHKYKIHYDIIGWQQVCWKADVLKSNSENCLKVIILFMKMAAFKDAIDHYSKLH